MCLPIAPCLRYIEDLYLKRSYCMCSAVLCAAYFFFITVLPNDYTEESNYKKGLLDIVQTRMALSIDSH